MPRTPVLRIRFAGEVPALLEMAQQIVDRLSGDPQLLCNLRGALAIEGGVAEESDVGRVQVVVAGGADSREDLLAHELPAKTQQCAQVWTVIRVRC